MDGSRREVEEFEAFGPKVIAAIGDLPSTIDDRAINIRLRRRASGEHLLPFRYRQAREQAEAIAFDWPTIEALGADVPVPPELDDRAADSWEPLVAVAESAGGPWPTGARLAAVALSATRSYRPSAGERLLADLQQVFRGDDHVTTHDLLKRLYRLEGAPWSTGTESR
jgi:hypothetical protein